MTAIVGQERYYRGFMLVNFDTANIYRIDVRTKEALKKALTKKVLKSQLDDDIRIEFHDFEKGSIGYNHKPVQIVFENGKWV